MNSLFSIGEILVLLSSKDINIAASISLSGEGGEGGEGKEICGEDNETGWKDSQSNLWISSSSSSSSSISFFSFFLLD
jgi:hypothetical protein